MQRSHDGLQGTRIFRALISVLPRPIRWCSPWSCAGGPSGFPGLTAVTLVRGARSHDSSRGYLAAGPGTATLSASFFGEEMAISPCRALCCSWRGAGLAVLLAVVLVALACPGRVRVMSPATRWWGRCLSHGRRVLAGDRRATPRHPVRGSRRRRHRVCRRVALELRVLALGTSLRR